MAAAKIRPEAQALWGLLRSSVLAPISNQNKRRPIVRVREGFLWVALETRQVQRRARTAGELSARWLATFRIPLFLFRVAVLQGQLRLAQGFPFRHLRIVSAEPVETSHQHLCAFIRDRPQTGDDRFGSEKLRDIGKALDLFAIGVCSSTPLFTWYLKKERSVDIFRLMDFATSPLSFKEASQLRIKTCETCCNDVSPYCIIR